MRCHREEVSGCRGLCSTPAVCHHLVTWIDGAPGLMQDTYRYHGHSISDPGSTYRTRDEIQGIRRARDPIEHVRTLLLEHGLAKPEDLKQIEADVKKVQLSSHGHGNI